MVRGAYNKERSFITLLLPLIEEVQDVVRPQPRFGSLQKISQRQ